VKKRMLLYAVFGLVFYLLFLIIEMPASWFAWGLNSFTHGTVRLDPIAGTMWHGTGKVVLYYPQNTPHDLGMTEWRLNPLWLVAGCLQSNWQNISPDAHINVTIRLSSGKVELIDTEASFQARSAGAFYPPAALISPLGEVKLHIGRIAMDNNGMEGDADIQWQGAGSSLTTVQPLGDYRLEITGAGKTANLKLSTVRGALELTGQGQWQTKTRQLQFNGFALPRERVSELDPLLKLLGNNQGDGKWALTIRTR
jgi:general secretion pathway protein N